MRNSSMAKFPLEQSSNEEDDEQQDYESEVNSDKCSEDTDIEIDYV